MAVGTASVSQSVNGRTVPAEYKLLLEAVYRVGCVQVSKVQSQPSSTVIVIKEQLVLSESDLAVLT